MEKLTVPENICLRTEFWRGFGKEELWKSLIVTGVVLAGLTAYCAIHGGKNDIIVSVLVLVFTFTFCTGFFGKVPGTNQSIYDFIKKQIRYKKEQQIFHYKKIEEVYCIAEETAKE